MACASCEMPLSAAVGITLYTPARNAIPVNIAIDSRAIHTSVAAAFRASGGRNAGTPSDTASTPVIAVQPFANAVSNRYIVNGFVPAYGGSGALTGTAEPDRYRATPSAMSASSVTTKK